MRADRCEEQRRRLAESLRAAEAAAAAEERCRQRLRAEQERLANSARRLRDRLQQGGLSARDGQVSAEWQTLGRQGVVALQRSLEQAARQRRNADGGLQAARSAVNRASAALSAVEERLEQRRAERDKQVQEARQEALDELSMRKHFHVWGQL